MRAVQQRSDLGPGWDPGSDSFKTDCIYSLLFAELAAALNFQRIGGDVLRRAAKPAGKNRFGPSDSALRARMMKTACVISSARCGVAHLAQRDGINQIDVPRDQRGKRLLGTVAEHTPATNSMSSVIILQYIPHRLENLPLYFAFRRCFSRNDVSRAAENTGKLLDPAPTVFRKGFVTISISAEKPCCSLLERSPEGQLPSPGLTATCSRLREKAG